MKKWTFWIVVTILVVIIIGLLWFICSDSSASQAEKLKATQQNEALQKIHFQDSLLIDFWQQKYNDCHGSVSAQPAPVVAVMSMAAPQVKKAVKPKAKTSATKKKKQKEVVNDVTENVLSESKFTKQVKSAQTRTEVTIVGSGTSLPNTTYAGQMIGDVGTTTNYDRYLIYYLKNVGLTGTNWFVNGDMNKKMILDKVANYWYYVDSSRKLTDEEIVSKVFTWNAKGDDISWGGGSGGGGGSYQAWCPHELLKALITSVRGFEYGFITNDDLNQMSRKDSRVWSPTNPNGVYQPLQGIVGKERTDPNFWHGWNFRTKISYKKTTISGTSGRKFITKKTTVNQYA